MALNDVQVMAVVFSVSGADGEIVNTHQYKLTQWSSSTTRIENLAELADFLQTQYEADLLPDLPTGVTLERIEGYVLQGGGVASVNLAVGTSGGVAGDFIPVRDAMVVNKQTGLRGRSFRGRNFLPPLSESNQNGGIVIAGFVSIVEDFYAGIVEFDNGAGDVFNMVVYSPTLTVDTENPVTNQVSNFVVNNRIGSIRRRWKT